MMKMILVLGAVLVSTSAFAQSPDFSTIVDEHGGHGKMHKCLMDGWKAAEPTDDQSNSAKGFMTDAKAVLTAHHDALKADMEAMKAAWKKHPIVRDEVVTAETALRTEATPVKEAFRDAGINILNLLSDDQRTKFDTTFAACVGHEE